MMRRLNVYEATMRRIEFVFENFEYPYVSFSGGKDSGVLLNMAIQYIRTKAPHRRMGVFHIDYEAQYQHTTDYVEKTLAQNTDILDVYHVCVPFKVQTCTSMYQAYWRPWEESKKDIWVRELPKNCLTARDFDFLTDEMWDYDFQYLFGPWLSRKVGGKSVCAMVGIRTQESHHRWRAIYSERNFRHYKGMKWTYRVDKMVYNSYPIYDWDVTDVWIANARFGWEYNRLYDLYHQAGVPVLRQRVASPFISQAIPTLSVYRVIDPDMWGKMISRVNGVNFACMYGKTMAMGWKNIECPSGFSWKDYMYFLLNTLPENIRNNYLDKLSVSIRFWREKGGCLAESTIEKLEKAGVKFTIAPSTNYRTTKKPVRMEYLDDIDIAEFQEIPTYKRMCICILKNDHVCKYMGFALTKQEKERRERIMEKYRSLKYDNV